MTAEEQEAMDKEDRETRERIRKKALYLAELNEQFDALLALVQRNERNEMEAKKKVPTPKKTKPVKKEAPTAEELVKGNRSGSAKKESTTRVKQGDEDNITTEQTSRSTIMSTSHPRQTASNCHSFSYKPTKKQR